MRALLKFILAGLIVFSLVAGILIWAKDWRIWQLEADEMVSWRPSQSHTETRYEHGVPWIPVAAQRERATIDRFLDLATAEDAALAEREANEAALRAGWTPSDREGSYSKEMNRGIVAWLEIRRTDSRLALSLDG